MEFGRKEEEAETYESRTTEAICIMKRMLPGYVAECLIAAGYGTIEAIANMNIDHEARNSLQHIEEYTNSTHPNYTKFMRTNVTANMFRFPLDHSQTIESFVEGNKTAWGWKNTTNYRRGLLRLPLGLKQNSTRQSRCPPTVAIPVPQ